MRKIIAIFSIVCIMLFSSMVYATNTETQKGTTDIPSLTIEQLKLSMMSKQAKIDIIKKNNAEIENYKKQLTDKIVVAAEKINNLKLEVSENSVIITEEKLNELKILLQFLQESSTTLEEDATKVSKEIDEILDLILTKGMQLEQYDQIIEKQNTVIVKMKNILNTVEKI